jgi:hypothetical protein
VTGVLTTQLPGAELQRAAGTSKDGDVFLLSHQ